MSNGFHEVRLPLRLSLGASGGPGRRTDIVALSNGGETRNARWADARRRYDVGTGLRGLDDLYRLIEFFEARRGQLYGFRFRDPVDHASAAHGQAVTAIDQQIGVGDGVKVAVRTDQDLCRCRRRHQAPDRKAGGGQRGAGRRTARRWTRLISRSITRPGLSPSRPDRCRRPARR
jgi:hypothetical protein